MPSASSLASVYLDVDPNRQEVPHALPDSPFRILVAGDFSGGANHKRAPLQIDRDNYEDVLARLAPQLRLQVNGRELGIAFGELDDFHPDRLFERLPVFAALRKLRGRLEDRATFAAAAAELAPVPAPQASPRPASGADVLRMMMGDAASPAPKPAPRSDWDRMIREIVAPYAEANPDPRQSEWIARTDAAIEGEMRAVLHHPRFQALEAAWRGLYFLISRLETGEDLKIYILDMPQAEAMSPSGLVELRRIAVDDAAGTPGAQPWAIIAGLYDFGPAHEPALLSIAAIAHAAGAPFLAGLTPDTVGLTKAFQVLRRSPDARWVGLALPRFLLRLPYGKATAPVESFEFEEMPSPPEHERYLWGRPAIACAYLLGEAFAQRGWEMRPGMVNVIEGLPLHVYRRDGESELKPCAEVVLTEEAADLLLDCGFIPLVSIKGSDRVRAFRIQSVAFPAASLAGRWE